MNILATEYSLRHKALELYLAGCRAPHCPGCHNPEGWDFKAGAPWIEWLPAIEEKMREPLVQNVWILGGEPLDQPLPKLEELVQRLVPFGKPIWLFTRYGFMDVPESILAKISYLKTGRYLEELRTDNNVHYGVKLATDNQCICRVN